MARYVHTPTVVEAIQWRGDWDAVCEWVGQQGHSNVLRLVAGQLKLYVEANDVWVPIDDGEWLLYDGGFYPCKNHVFRESYEAERYATRPVGISMERLAHAAGIDDAGHPYPPERPTGLDYLAMVAEADDAQGQVDSHGGTP